MLSHPHVSFRSSDKNFESWYLKWPNFICLINSRTYIDVYNDITDSHVIHFCSLLLSRNKVRKHSDTQMCVQTRGSILSSSTSAIIWNSSISISCHVIAFIQSLLEVQSYGIWISHVVVHYVTSATCLLWLLYYSLWIYNCFYYGWFVILNMFSILPSVLSTNYLLICMCLYSDQLYLIYLIYSKPFVNVFIFGVLKQFILCSILF